MTSSFGPARNVLFAQQSHGHTLPAHYLLRLLIAQLHGVVAPVERVVTGCLVRAHVYHQFPCLLVFLHKAFPKIHHVAMVTYADCLQRI